MGSGFVKIYCRGLPPSSDREKSSTPPHLHHTGPVVDWPHLFTLVVDPHFDPHFRLLRLLPYLWRYFSNQVGKRKRKPSLMAKKIVCLLKRADVRYGGDRTMSLTATGTLATRRPSRSHRLLRGLACYAASFCFCPASERRRSLL